MPPFETTCFFFISYCGFVYFASLLRFLFSWSILFYSIMYSFIQRRSQHGGHGGLFGRRAPFAECQLSGPQSAVLPRRSVLDELLGGAQRPRADLCLAAPPGGREQLLGRGARQGHVQPSVPRGKGEWAARVCVVKDSCLFSFLRCSSIRVCAYAVS